MAIHIVTEAERCLNCKRPMCQEGCPVHTPIPQIIQMFKQGKVMEAGEILFQNNPMSAICSIVCNHEQQCAGHCIRGKKDTPIHFSSIENYISDMYLDRMEIQKPEPKDKKVAVIGAGPAGLTVAIRLAQQGYPVTVFEWEDKIGGIMQYGIPEFRLPKSVLDRLQKRMEEMGITIRLNTTIGAVLMVDNLFRDGYSCVFVGTGADRPKSLGIEGESLGNVRFGLNYLANPQRQPLGDNVAVIGMAMPPWTWRGRRCATVPVMLPCMPGASAALPAPASGNMRRWTAQSLCSASRFGRLPKRVPCSRPPSLTKTTR